MTDKKAAAKKARAEAKKARKAGDDAKADLLEIAAENLDPKPVVLDDEQIDDIVDFLLS